MDIISFVTKLGEKFAPVDASVIKTLQIQLTDEYNVTLKKYLQKMEKNDVIKFEIESNEKELDRAIEQGNEQEGKDIAYRINQLKKEIQKPSLFERGVWFFDKPWVKLVLLLSFGLVSALIARRILGKKKVEEEPLDEPNEGYAQGYPNHPPYYPPYPPYPYAPYGNGRKNDY